METLTISIDGGAPRTYVRVPEPDGTVDTNPPPASSQTTAINPPPAAAAQSQVDGNVQVLPIITIPTGNNFFNTRSTSRDLTNSSPTVTKISQPIIIPPDASGVLVVLMAPGPGSTGSRTTLRVGSSNDFPVAPAGFQGNLSFTVGAYRRDDLQHLDTPFVYVCAALQDIVALRRGQFGYNANKDFDITFTPA